MKKFAIGLSPLNYYNNDLEAFDSFCKRNDYRIQHWYAGIPCTWKYKEIKYDDYKKQKENFKNQLRVISNNNQDFQLAVNVDVLKYGLPKFLGTIIVFFWVLLFKINYSRCVKVSSVVCLDSNVKIIKLLYPKATYTYSFCNNIKQTKLKNIKYFDTIVLGREHIKDLKYFKYLKDTYGIKIELLLNCSCHFLCDYFCMEPSCKELQRKLIEDKGLDWCIAHQSVIPSELLLYPDDLIDFYKLSTRPSTLDWMESELNLYEDKKCLSEMDFIYSRPEFWKLVCCTTAISDLIDEYPFDVNNILEMKSEEWSKKLKKKVRVY